MSSPEPVETVAWPKALHPRLRNALTERGYLSLTPVQTAVLQKEAIGRDLLVSARTGSGKTVAYGLALADAILADTGELPPPSAPLALVIAPTRELALQVQRELEWLYRGVVVASCVGGMDPRAERRLLERGAQIVVGTPGRLRDHLERGQLDLHELAAVVLDEADEMLDLGFREELEAILDAAPQDRRTLLFSATLPKPIVDLASTYQKKAVRLSIGGGEQGHADIDYRVVTVAPSEIEAAVVNVLRFFDPDGALIFCATREGVKRLSANLNDRGFGVATLSGELSQNERSRALQDLRDRRARICVATDVAARGLDIPDLDLVIHADLPTNRETLQHRSGRTGRAGRKGVAILLAPHPKRRRLDQMLKGARLEAKWQAAPTADEIRAKDETRMISQVASFADASEEDQVLARKLAEGRDVLDIAAALVALSRTRMPAPEELAESGPIGPPASRDERPRFQDGPRYHDAGEPEAPRPGFEDASWYRIELGRSKNAEARWLLPLICRRGHVTRTDIGAIRVFERETRFQIAASAVEQFDRAVAKGDSDGGRIAKLDITAEPPPRDRSQSSKSYRKATTVAEPSSKPYRDGPKPHNRADAPDWKGKDKKPLEGKWAEGQKPFEGKPFKDKPFKDKPRFDKGVDGKPNFVKSKSKAKPEPA